MTRRVILTLENGQEVVMDLLKVEFMNACPHCEVEFRTVEPRKMYPDDTHRAEVWQQRKRRVRAHVS